MYVDAAYCYPVAWSVGLSVCYISEPCKNGLTDRDALWVEELGGSKEPCIKDGGSDPPSEGGKGRAAYCKVQTLR